ncbi:hypothetical protein D8674_040163 [Pyrus ussuriensis x Pyrus communis]|uniref:Protein kinase domain-containing protein n=1 Tax=Pyrus ussuriensis x Pyrus communis TaxID=2448454 RepID=A0A5N5G7Q1_9ROSA|nr:hypothetical protein D8674_040163 [Pyrus ussuriensis x Pyrus communis]
MTTMKEPPLSRRRRPTCHQPKKLKLVCCFKGAFHTRPPSGKLRYVGGEARIVSVDRNIVYSKLRSKILDLCPNSNPSFTLVYQLPGSGSDSDSAAPLVIVASDDDVRCMIEEYDKLELYGKSPRLWVFVCCSNVSDDVNGYVNCVKGVKFSNGLESESEHVGTHHRHLGGEAHVEEKTAVKNFGGGRSGDESLRKKVLKRQLLAKQSAFRRRFGAGESDVEMGFLGESQKGGSFDNRLGTNCGDNLESFSVSRASPLNPRDGNLRLKGKSYGQCYSGRSGRDLCNGVGRSSQAPPAKPVPGCNGCCSDAKLDYRNNGMAGISYVNRENIMPWEWGSDSLAGTTVYPVKSSCSGDRAWCSLKSRIRNHRFCVNDARNKRCCHYHVWNHNRINIAEMGSHRTRQGISARKCYPGLRPNLKIAKQGQPVRVYNPSLWRQCSGFSEHAMEERLRMMGSSSTKDGYLIDNPSGSYSGNCGAYTGVGNQSLVNSDAIESSSPSVKTMDILEDRLTGSKFGKCECPYQTSYENLHGMPGYCELEKETRLMDSHEVANTSGFPSEVGCRNGLEGDNKLPDGEAVIDALHDCKNGINDIQVSCSGVPASVSVSLHNLSLSSSKEVEAPQLSSHASSVVSSDVKHQSKPIDLMDEGQFTPDHQVDESNGVAPNPASQNSAKKEKDNVHDEEVQQDPSSGITIDEKANNKVIGGTSSDLAAFYAHLATRELQTIKSSDLEFIKELGSGTYGTVYYGKWKGSDVAIKKIKPSCFTEDTVKQERLLADFWKEARILSQLHHPNIVAFYGVVSDGPVTDLATVTEYMVNGSLKQVLQKKDRTIDRRKRLIIAMDAAFGMEYLHEKNIVHFDLKSHNFLVNMRDPQRPVCKIGDLGLSKIKQRTLVSGGVRGTIPWMAPELLSGNNNLVTEKVDVYSFGIVMWELLTGEEPYGRLRSEEMIAGIIKGSLRPEIPSWCDPTWRSLMERCWSSDPNTRPTFSEIAKDLRAMSAAMNIK